MMKELCRSSLEFLGGSSTWLLVSTFSSPLVLASFSIVKGAEIFSYFFGGDVWPPPPLGSALENNLLETLFFKP